MWDIDVYRTNSRLPKPPAYKPPAPAFSRPVEDEALRRIEFESSLMGMTDEQLIVLIMRAYGLTLSEIGNIRGYTKQMAHSISWRFKGLAPSKYDNFWNDEVDGDAWASIDLAVPLTDEPLGAFREIEEQNPMDNAKKCSKCKQIKPLSAFYKRSGGGNKYRSACKDCCSEYDKPQNKKETDRLVQPAIEETLVSPCVVTAIINSLVCRLCGESVTAIATIDLKSKSLLSVKGLVFLSKGVVLCPDCASELIQAQEKVG